MHYSLAARASDNRKRLSLAGQSPRDLHNLSPAHHSKANMARPAEANMPLLLSLQVLRGLHGAVSVLPWQQKQAIRALWRNVRTWGPIIHLWGWATERWINGGLSPRVDGPLLCFTGNGTLPPVCQWGQVRVTIATSRGLWPASHGNQDGTLVGRLRRGLQTTQASSKSLLAGSLPPCVGLTTVFHLTWNQKMLFPDSKGDLDSWWEDGTFKRSTPLAWRGWPSLGVC